MSNSKIILPYLPENLESLHKEEERIRTEALLTVNADTVLKDHLNMIHASLDAIFIFTHEYEKKTDDELTIQLLGIRIFNASASALALMLAGYYQNSLTLLRDLLETGFLIDYFTIDRSKIQDWQRSNDRERENKFGPVKIREVLDKNDSTTGKKRYNIYKLMCNYGIHPTYKGFHLVAPNGLGNIGPFFNQKFLVSLIEELVKHLAYFAIVYTKHFDDIDDTQVAFMQAKLDFMNYLKPWAEKYLGTNLNVDLDQLNQLIRWASGT